MKKLLAVLMALTLALSCVSALAGETATDNPALKTDIRVSADRNIIIALAGMGDSEGSTTNADVATAALDLLDNATFSVTLGDAVSTLDVLLGDTAILTGALTVGDENVVITSSAIPSYALTMSAQEAQAMLSSLTGEDLSAIKDELANIAKGYIEDVSAVANAAMESAVIYADGSIEIPVSSYQVAGLLSLWMARFGQDRKLISYTEKALEKSAEQTGDDANLYAALADIYEAIADIYDEPERPIGLARVITEEDGSQTIEAEIIGKILISLNASEAEGGASAFTLIVVAADNTENLEWSAVYDAIVAGEETDGAVVSLNAASSETDEATSADVVLNITADGATYSVTLSALATGEGTPAFNSHVKLDVDIGMGTPLVTITTDTSYAAAPAAPVTEGLTVINLATANEETAEALNADLMGYGLTGLLTAAQGVMPEQVTLILNALFTVQEPIVEETTVPDAAPAGV